MHEKIHRAQDPFVGGRTGGWSGSAEELLSSSKKGLDSIAHIKGDLKIPRTGEILAKDVTPAQAYEKLMEWLTEELAKRDCK